MQGRHLANYRKKHQDQASNCKHVNPGALYLLNTGNKDQEDRASEDPYLWNVLGMQSIDVSVRFNPVIQYIMTPDPAQTRKPVSSIAHESIRAGYASLLAEITYNPEMFRSVSALNIQNRASKLRSLLKFQMFMKKASKRSFLTCSSSRSQKKRLPAG